MNRQVRDGEVRSLDSPELETTRSGAGGGGGMGKNGLRTVERAPF